MAPSSSVTTSSAPASSATSITLSSFVPGAKMSWPQCLNWNATEPVGAHVAAVLAEGVAHFGHGAHMVVGHGVDDDGRAADAVALVADFFVVDAFGVAGGLVDVVLDAVGRQVGGLGLLHRQAQARVGAEVTATGAGRDGDLADDARPDLSALFVLAPLAVLNVRPFAVSGHGISFCYPDLIYAFDSTFPDHAMAEPLLIAKNASTACELLPALANRHGLITGATGTGKTVTLQTLAENFSRIGVPVFMADVKGDLTGISQAGSIGDKLAATLKERGIEPAAAAGLPRHAVGRVRRTGPPGARHHFRHGPAAAGPHARTSTRPSSACSTWCSRSPTTTACCCST